MSVSCLSFLTKQIHAESGWQKKEVLKQRMAKGMDLPQLTVTVAVDQMQKEVDISKAERAHTP